MSRDYHELNHAEKRTYNRAIMRTHERKIHLHLETLDGDPVATLTPRVLEGSVGVDVTSDVSHRILTMTILDPFRVLNFEPSNPRGSNLHRKFRVRVTDSRRIIGLGEWVDCDVHTGPLYDFDRTGPEVHFTAHGVDRLCRGTIRKPRAWRPKTKKTKIMRELLGEAGMVVMRIPDRPAVTSRRITVGFAFRHHQKHIKGKHGTKGHDVTVTNRIPRTDHYVEKAEQLADSMNSHLYFDGYGIPTLRPFPERPVLRFTHGLLADPKLGRPGSDGPNTWLILGSKPKGSHKRVKAKVALPPGNDLSPQSLAVNQKPYVVQERIENPHLKRTRECKAVGVRHRDRAARVVAELEVDLMPVPWLNEWDMILVQTNLGDVTVLMKQWTYPLGEDQTPMHVGSTVKPRPIHHSRGIG